MSVKRWERGDDLSMTVGTGTKGETAKEHLESGLCMGICTNRELQFPRTKWCTNRQKEGELYCGVHNDAAIKWRSEAADRKEAQQEKFRQRRLKERRVLNNAWRLIAAISLIAEGHEDPVKLAKDTLDNMDIGATK